VSGKAASSDMVIGAMADASGRLGNRGRRDGASDKRCVMGESVPESA
jgi:hypothetical protein